MNEAEKKDTRTICIMIGDVSYDFSTELVKGYFDAASQENVRLLMMIGMPRHSGYFETAGEPNAAYHFNSIYDYARLSGADAYVFSCGALSGFESENTYQEFLKRFAGTPYVILQENVDVAVRNASCITVDNRSSFSECIEHLITVHGYRNIACVGGLKEHPDTRERVQAYRDTMAKHALPVTDMMVVYGDYSEYSDSMVAWLLEHNPGLEAIAFCNDEMAKGGYRECAKRGLKIGKDIAITGFDNFTTAHALIPPLTTISQNTYQMGAMAVQQVAALMNGEPVSCAKLNTHLLIRRSCGCNPNTVSHLFLCDLQEDRVDINTVIENVAQDLIDAYTHGNLAQAEWQVRRLTDYIAQMCQADLLQIFDKMEFANWLQSYCDENEDAVTVMVKRLNDYIMQIPPEKMERVYIRKLYSILAFVHGYILSYKARTAERNLDDFRAQSWFIPELIRDLVGYDIENESVFLYVAERLHSLHINHIYICLLPEARSLHDSTEFSMPGELRLVAYHSGDAAKAYRQSQAPVIDSSHPLRDLPDMAKETNIMCFSIFSGDLQYGIILCEVDIAKSPLMHIIGLQLGILINFLDLKQKEKIVGNELENIRERNEILNFLSEYDSMCAILNRRGFIERAIRLNRENVGKHAICVFMDLDHLKEINDTFGHAQGDVALAAVSSILKQTVRNNDLVARIGGDEFIGMFIIDSPEYDDIFRARIKKSFDEYNRTSGLPYYVEASVGIAHFNCNQGMEISKIVNDADHYLYKAKRQKRNTALKYSP